MFHIVKHCKWFFALSLLIIIPGLVSMATRGFNWGIDFTGGNIIELKFTQEVTLLQVRDALKTFGLENSSIQVTGGTSLEQGDGVMIRSHVLSEQERREVLDGLSTQVGQFDILRIEKVGAIVGSELTRNAILAMAAGVLGILIYIAFRFEWKFGVAGIIALVHDLLVVLGIFSLTQKEMDSTFVAALMTILGYSINDTVVIFDRIRENLKQMKKDDNLSDLADRSIWQTMRRSIYTVLTVVFATTSLLLFGGETTKTFAFALVIGFVSGCYSSIFNATPLWVIFHNWGKKTAMTKVASAKAK